MRKFCSKPINSVSIPGYNFVFWLKLNRVRLDTMQEKISDLCNHGKEICMSKAHTKTIYITTNIYNAFFNKCNTVLKLIIEAFLLKNYLKT